MCNICLSFPTINGVIQPVMKNKDTLNFYMLRLRLLPIFQKYVFLFVQYLPS